MLTDSESVLPSGPASVITWNSSNTWNAEIIVRIDASKIVGFSSGSVMCRKICHGLAPSTLAASVTDRGIACRAAMKITRLYPMSCQR